MQFPGPGWLNIFTERDLFNNSVDMHLVRATQEGKRYHWALQITETEIDEGVAHSFEPSIRLDMRDAQDLFDQLWRHGLRPNNGESSLAHVEAMKGHIQFAERVANRLLNTVDASPLAPPPTSWDERNNK